MKNLSKYSLEELYNLSNEQILSKWSLLASFIRLYENGEQKLRDWGKKWHQAREKAIELLKSESAEEYLNKARMHRSQNVEPVETVPIVEPIEVEQSMSVQRNDYRKFSIYEKNYEQLLKLIPNLEQLIIDDNPDLGYSNTVGFNGYLVCVVSTMYDNKSTGQVQFYHFVRDSNSFYVELDIELRVDIVRSIVEVARFRTNEENSSVYHLKEGYDRELIDPKEQKRLNKLFLDWLNATRKYKHRFIWGENEEANSDLIDELMQHSFNYSPRQNDEYAELLEQKLTKEKTKSKKKRKKLKREQQLVKGELEMLKLKERIRVSRELEEKRIKEQELQQQAELEAVLKDPNKEIPEFEIGAVELTRAHQIIGIRQEDIDAINSTGRLVWLVCNGENTNGITHIQLLPNGTVQLGLLSNNKS